MQIKDPTVKEELTTMIQEVDQIADDLNRLLVYQQEREAILRQLLAESSLN